jgi:nucleoside-diphosphate-sugar epimerase
VKLHGRDASGISSVNTFSPGVMSDNPLITSVSGSPADYEGRENMRVLVTGAAGFAASHLCERLVQKGYRVRGLVRDLNRSSDLRRKGVELALGDIREPRCVTSAVNGMDIIYHIAAAFRVENLPGKEMWETNVEGTRNLLDAAVQAGVKRFVHCSTVGVHGDIQNPPANEKTPYGPGDQYQKSKAEGERVVLQYMNEGRLPVVVFRPGGIFGPGDLRFLKLFRAIKRGRFVMLGSGHVMYHMIYIDDLVDGILLCGTHENSLGGIFILAGEQAATLNELVRMIAESLGVHPPRLHFPVAPVYLTAHLCELICKPFGINPPLYRRRVDFFRKNRAFDVSKAKRELGFSPKTDLKTGIALTTEWYRKQGLI